MSRRQDDIKLLQRALLSLDENADDKRTTDAIDAFTDMLEKLRAKAQKELTQKQRTWVLRILDEPEYTNDWSEGRVPRGREVPTPAVLQNRPLRPPGK